MLKAEFTKAPKSTNQEQQPSSSTKMPAHELFILIMAVHVNTDAYVSFAACLLLPFLCSMVFILLQPPYLCKAVLDVTQ